MLSTLLDTVRAGVLYARERFSTVVAARAPAADRRVLLITSDFPPVVSGGSYRPASFARYASAMGWDVTVLTPAPPAEPSPAGLQLLEYVGDVDILRAPKIRLAPSYRLFPKVDGGMMEALNLAAHARHALPGKRFPGTIVATGPSFNTFVAAYFLARTSGARLVLEYRDEWTLCPFDFVSKSPSNAWWERRCLQRADLVIVTTEAQRQWLQLHFSQEVADKCEVIPNGWEPHADAAELSDRRDDGGGQELEPRCMLTFAGTLGSHTDPAPFLRSLESVLARRPELQRRVHVRFVGRKIRSAEETLAAFPLQGVVSSVPLVPAKEAVRMMRESDALLLLHDARFERYIPGKLYEYVATGRHILLLDDGGESHRIVESLGVGSSFQSNDASSLETALDRLLAQAREDCTASKSTATERWLLRHTRRSLAGEFYALLDKQDHVRPTVDTIGPDS